MVKKRWKIIYVFGNTWLIHELLNPRNFEIYPSIGITVVLLIGHRKWAKYGATGTLNNKFDQ
jgi:hypothetical protein